MSGSADERQGTARYLQALAQHWPFILGSVALAVVTAVAYLLVADRRYEAHADILVTPVALNDNTFVGLPVMRESGEGRGVLTAARLVETPGVADSVRRQLGVRTSRDDLFESVRVEPQEQSSIVTITAEAGSAARAAAIANAFATGVIAVRTGVFQRELRPLIQRLSRRLDAIPEGSRDEGEGRALADRLATLRGLTNAPDPTLQVASLAVAPPEASWPRPLLSLAAAVFAGLLLGIGVAIALELVNPLVLRDEDVLEERTPLLARVPRVSMRDLERHLRHEAAFGSDVKDAYQLARLNINAAFPAQADEGTILVTSPTRGEGKTSAAAPKPTFTLPTLTAASWIGICGYSVDGYADLSIKGYTIGLWSASLPDPPPLNWSTLKYVLRLTGGPQCPRSVTSRKKSSPSYARSM